jgi:hypothetical protein
MMDQIVSRWQTALLNVHAHTNGGRAIANFLRDPTAENRPAVGLYSVHGPLAQDTLTALDRIGSDTDERAQALELLADLASRIH